MEHKYSNGYEAAAADGWCTSCLRADPLPDRRTCASCREGSNIRSRNRNDRRPSSRLTRRDLQALFDAAALKADLGDGSPVFRKEARDRP